MGGPRGSKSSQGTILDRKSLHSTTWCIVQLCLQLVGSSQNINANSCTVGALHSNVYATTVWMLAWTPGLRRHALIYPDKGGLLLERKHHPRCPKYFWPLDFRLDGLDLLKRLPSEVASRPTSHLIFRFFNFLSESGETNICTASTSLSRLFFTLPLSHGPFLPLHGRGHGRRRRQRRAVAAAAASSSPPTLSSSSLLPRRALLLLSPCLFARCLSRRGHTNGRRCTRAGRRLSHLHPACVAASWWRLSHLHPAGVAAS